MNNKHLFLQIINILLAPHLKIWHQDRLRCRVAQISKNISLKNLIISFFVRGTDCYHF